MKKLVKKKNPGNKKNIVINGLPKNVNSIYESLKANYPDLFFDKILPIDKGVKDIILANTEKLNVTRRQLKRFIHLYCRNKNYKTAVANGGHRYNLDGQITTPITKAEIINAKQCLLNFAINMKKQFELRQKYKNGRKKTFVRKAPR